LKNSLEEEVAKELKSIESKFKSQFTELGKEFSDLKSTIETSQKSKVTKKEVKDLGQKINEKVGLKEVQAALNQMQGEIASKLMELSENMWVHERQVNL